MFVCLCLVVLALPRKTRNTPDITLVLDLVRGQYLVLITCAKGPLQTDSVIYVAIVEAMFEQIPENK